MLSHSGVSPLVTSNHTNIWDQKIILKYTLCAILVCQCDLSAKDDDITLGYVHLSSAKLTKGIAIFYAKTSAERSLNISKASAYYKIACQQNDELLTINY